MPAAPTPATPPQGRAAVVSGRDDAALSGQVAALGFAVDAFADPYTAFAAVCRRPLVYRALVLALSGLHREELPVVAATRGRFAHVEVWLARTDGRPAALAEGLALGASAILGDDGLHRLAPAPTPTTPTTGAAAPADAKPIRRDPPPTRTRETSGPTGLHATDARSVPNGQANAAARSSAPTRRADPPPDAPRKSVSTAAVAERRPASPKSSPRPDPVSGPDGDDDALLTAAELRALLSDGDAPDA